MDQWGLYIYIYKYILFCNWILRGVHQIIHMRTEQASKHISNKIRQNCSKKLAVMQPNYRSGACKIDVPEALGKLVGGSGVAPGSTRRGSRSGTSIVQTASHAF